MTEAGPRRGDGALDSSDPVYAYDAVAMAENVTSLMLNMTATNLTSNRSVDDLLERYLGVRHGNMGESVVLTIVYGIIFFTGLIGNVSTCIVITKNNYMHTATNYYLFSLAISDVLTLILGLPPELYAIWEAYPWRLGAAYCLFKTFLTEMTSSASILTIAAFTVERYVAICHPIKAQTMSTLSRAVKIIVAIWFTAALSALPYPIHTRIYYHVTNPDTQQPVPDSLICNILPKWLSRMRYVFQFSTFLLFILPMGLITYLYVLIGITLRKSGLARQTSECSGSPPHSQSRRSVLKMLGPQDSVISRRASGFGSRRRKRREIVHGYLVAVVVAFFICWAPFHSQRLMTVYVSDDDWTPRLLETQSLLFYISGVLFFVSSTVNPILYNLMSKKYRQAFKETLCWCFLPSTARVRRFKRQMRSGYDTGTTVSYAHGNSSRYASKRQSHAQTSPLMNRAAQARNPHRQLSDTSDDEIVCTRGIGAFRNDAMWRERPTQNLPGRHAYDSEVNDGVSTRVPFNGSLRSGIARGNNGRSSRCERIPSNESDIEMTRVGLARL